MTSKRKRKKGIKSKAAWLIMLVTLIICIASSFAIVQYTKISLASMESKLPESAISTYLQQVKKDDFNGIYENSLKIDPHLNKQEDYIQAIKDIYTDTDLDNLIYQEEESSSTDLQYGLYDGNTKVAVIKLIEDSDGTWLASTLFQGDKSSVIEAPADVKFTVNGLEIDSKYISKKDSPAMNFSGLKDTKSAPKITRYELNNLITEPTIEVIDSGYTTIKDVLSNTYYVGKKSTDSDLQNVVLNAAKTCAKYPTKDGTLGAISAITITESDFYDRIRTMDNQWYAAHGVSQFSNENVLSIVQQDEQSMIANVVFDYYIAAGSTSKEYNIGYQISFLNVKGSWKIAGFAIDNELNDKTKKY